MDVKDRARILRWRDHATGLALGATIILLPLIVQPLSFDAFRYPKALFVRVAALVLLTIYAVAAIWAPPSGEWLRTEWSRKKNRFFWTIAFILSWTALSAALSSQPAISWWGVADTFFGFTLFLAAYHFTSRTGDARLVYLVFIPGLINVGVLVFQLADIWHPFISRQELAALRSSEAALVIRAGLMGNRDDLGMFFLIPLIVSLALFWNVRLRVRLAAVALAIVFLCGIILTTTLTAILATTFLIIWFAYFRTDFGKGSPRFRISILLLLVGSVLLVYSWEPVGGRIRSYGAYLQDADWERVTGGRLRSFSAAAIMIKEHPFVGVGPSRYPVEYVPVARRLRVEMSDLLTRDDGRVWDMVHNDYLEIAAESGVPTLLASIVFFTQLMLRSLNSTRQSGTALKPGFLCAGLVLTMSVSALTLFPLQIAGVYGSAALLGGCALGLQR